MQHIRVRTKYRTNKPSQR